MAVTRLLADNLDLLQCARRPRWHGPISNPQSVNLALTSCSGWERTDSRSTALTATGTAQRWMRVVVARVAEETLKLQFEDAVRLKIEDLDETFCGVQAANLHVAYAKAYENGMRKLADTFQRLVKVGIAERGDLSKVTTQRDLAALQLRNAVTELHKAKLSLANLLNMPDAEVNGLDAGGTMKIETEDPSPAEELVRIGMAHRSDLKACRLGLLRAHLELIPPGLNNSQLLPYSTGRTVLVPGGSETIQKP